MTWTPPKTWVTNEPLTASDLNTHLRDNLLVLKAPASDQYSLNEGFNYTTSSTNFVNIDGSLLSLPITTTGGDVLIGFNGTFSINTPLVLYLNVTVDGVQIADNDGIGAWTLYAGAYFHMSFVRLKTGLSAGNHTFNLQWKVSANTATLYAGAGTSGGDVHPQFWIQEV